MVEGCTHSLRHGRGAPGENQRELPDLLDRTPPTPSVLLVKATLPAGSEFLEVLFVLHMEKHPFTSLSCSCWLDKSFSEISFSVIHPIESLN